MRYLSLFSLLAVLLVLTVLFPGPAHAHGYGAGLGVTPTQVLVQQDAAGNQFRVTVLSTGQVLTEPLNGLFIDRTGFARVNNTLIFRSGLFNTFVPIRNRVVIVR